MEDWILLRNLDLACRRLVQLLEDPQSKREKNIMTNSFPILLYHLQEWLPDHSLGTCLEAFSSDQGLYIYSPPVDLQLGWNKDTCTLHHTRNSKVLIKFLRSLCGNC
ncbi:hypothetical protein CHUAL_000066 [Chamberlinius hualienensis]